jgi:16S rRNA (cytosine1402-N4)-methyltransferase
MHIPVLLKEVVEILDPKPGEFVVDLTAGGGGHAFEFAKKIGKSGTILLIDWDEKVISEAEKKIFSIPENERPEVILCISNFARLDEIMNEIEGKEKKEKIKKPDIFFADLGISSFHLDDPSRGFSFRFDSPLDMRISSEIKLKAKDVVMNFSEKELAEIIEKYGEDRLARKIAKEIVKQRKIKEISTTKQLAEIVERVYKREGIFYTKIHPATRTFQALRIYINREIENLGELLEKIPDFSKSGTRVGIISFHSLEDRLVKTKFKEWEKLGMGKILTRKPVVPSEEEIILNPRSRSAKFRAFVFL